MKMFLRGGSRISLSLLVLCLSLGLLSVFSLHWFKSSGYRSSAFTDSQTGDVFTYYDKQPFVRDPSIPQTELGLEADEAFNLGSQSSTWLSYLQTLSTFLTTDDFLPSTLSQQILHGLQAYTYPYVLPHFTTQQSSKQNKLEEPKQMIDSKVVWQTDKDESDEGGKLLRDSWKIMNKGWEYKFLDDAAGENFIAEEFSGSQIEWAWNFMKRPVLKADFLRYILPMVDGGLYSDVDVECRKPIVDWGNGTTEVEYYQEGILEGYDYGLDRWWKKGKPYKQPSVIIGVDVDVHDFEGFLRYWPRALGICQWTLSSAPHHPIFVDAVRRVVNATRFVHDNEQMKVRTIARLETLLADLPPPSTSTPSTSNTPPLSEDEAEGDYPSFKTSEEDESLLKKQEEIEDERRRLTVELENERNRNTNLPIMEWTGPGLFTDSVLSYLLARYNVTWPRLRKLKRPLRIGEVLILPITGLSPNGQADFHAENEHSVQNCVVHHFRASWKSGGM